MDEHTRLYTEREIGALIQRASELQERGRDRPERGLSFQELEHIASEVGISPAHLREAAEELARGSDAPGAVRLLGGPFSLREKRIVDASFSEEQWASVVEGLRRITGSDGQTTRVGQSFEWSRERNMDFVVERTGVTLQPGETRTGIEVRKRYGGGAMLAYSIGLFLGTGAGGIMAGTAGFPGLVDGLIVAGGVAGGLGAARTVVAYWTSRQKAELKRISDWLYNMVSQSDATGDSEKLVQSGGEDSQEG